MSDACCGPEETQPATEEDGGPQRFWQVRELQSAAVAAVLLGVGC